MHHLALCIEDGCLPFFGGANALYFQEGRDRAGENSNGWCEDGQLVRIGDFACTNLHIVIAWWHFGRACFLDDDVAFWILDRIAALRGVHNG